ncbi:MAG: nitrate reductase [Chloroflexi bacterium CG07_land_8_20_14_0_80_51_10]|nr:MAG: nitrate reductase [Chloroflexi bacterium CG07_land_8_20_14_0_80_51_10]
MTSSINVSPTDERVIPTNCTLCVNSCGINVHVKEGKIIKVKGMPEHPLSKGALCPRGAAILDWEYAPERLKYPMKKVNGEWKRITWDEALDVIASKLREIKERQGARAVAVQVGSIGGEDRESTCFAQRFSDVYGTPNFLDPGICYTDIIRGRMLTFGRLPFEEPEGSKCIVLWGHNPEVSDPPKARRIREAIKGGAKLVVIDPKRIPFARQADVHIRPRPGTDLALALAMLNVIIDEGIYDDQFIDRWAIGFDELKAHVKQYTPEWAEEVTWVSSGDIRRIALMYAESESACIIQSTCGLGQQASGLQTARALSLLQAVTGNVYLPGTWIRIPMPHWTNHRIEIEERPIGVEDYPLYEELWGRRFRAGQGISLPDAVLEGKPYPVKAVILIAGNFVVTQPESQRFRKTFKKLDFFVVVDVFMTETAKLAHIVLPAATSLEKTGLGYTYAVTQGIPYVSLRPRVAEPPEECWSEFKFWTELAKRMGYEEYFPWKTEEDFVDFELSDMGLSAKKLRELPHGGLFFATTKHGDEAYKDGFPTPSGKIELYSETLKSYGYDPLPTYREPTESPVSTPELAKDYPLILISGTRERNFTHSEMRNIARLRNKTPQPLAEVHPDTARMYGVADGEMTAVETKKGSITIKIRATEDIAPGVVSIPHGWAQANVNMLTDTKLRDPITGIAQVKAILCRLRKA